MTQIQYTLHDTEPSTVHKIQWDANLSDIVDFLDNTYPIQKSGDFLMIYLPDANPRAAALNGVEIVAKGHWLSK